MRIKNTNAEIKRKIANAFRKQVYDKIQSIVPSLQSHIRGITLSIWKESDTYNSLLYGNLNHEIGFPKGTAQSIVDPVLNALSNSIEITTQRNTKKTLTINVFQKDIVLKPFEEIDIEQDDPDKKDELDWFHWLTTFGNKYIIWQYEYVPEVTPRSRSGKGIMKYSKDTQGWKIPDEHSGTIDSNWLTRALNENTAIESAYASIIEYYINR